MKKSGVSLLLSILISGLLQSCAPPPSVLATTYDQGKTNFAAQNYTLAFKDLLPSAQAGNPNAQYAVGYMYFYGKGVNENRALAQYWMSKAAAQGQPAAIKALAIVKTGG